MMPTVPSSILTDAVVQSSVPTQMLPYHLLSCDHQSKSATHHTMIPTDSFEQEQLTLSLQILSFFLLHSG